MSLDDEQKRLAGEAARILTLILEDKLSDSSLTVPDGMTWDDLQTLIDDLALEDELDENVEAADDALQDIADILAGIHRKAADVTVDMPSDQQIEGMKEKLGELSEHLEGDQNFERAAKLAGSLADLIEAT